MFGELVLRYLDVSIESLSIAGGLLLLLVALEMLRGTDFPTGDSEDVALVPLATPLVAGPGAIATAIVLWREHPHAGGHCGGDPGDPRRGRLRRARAARSPSG